MSDKRRYLPRDPSKRSKPICDEDRGSIAEAGYTVRFRAPMGKHDREACCWPPRNPNLAPGLMDEREAEYSSYLKD